MNFWKFSVINSDKTVVCNKKILISVGGFAAVIVILVAMLLILGGNSDDNINNYDTG